jgi:hypothetical protein
MSTDPMVVALKSELNLLLPALGFRRVTGRLFGRRAILFRLPLNPGQLRCRYVLLTGRSNPFCGKLCLVHSYGTVPYGGDWRSQSVSQSSSSRTGTYCMYQ